MNYKSQITVQIVKKKNETSLIKNTTLINHRYLLYNSLKYNDTRRVIGVISKTKHHPAKVLL